MVENGRKWAKMGENGRKWVKIVIITLTNKLQRIVSQILHNSPFDVALATVLTWPASKQSPLLCFVLFCQIRLIMR
jgi:hypothetical protein